MLKVILHSHRGKRYCVFAVCVKRLWWSPYNIVNKYRKRPCISRTFFHKIEAKNQGCGLSMDTSEKPT